MIRAIDSHTAGEPTRTVLEGGPDLGNGSVAERLQRLKQEHDWLRTTTILEPRGSDVLVGALLLPSYDPSCVSGVIFFNNFGYLNMCGHGMIGVAASLAHLGRIEPGVHRLETSVGIVTVELVTPQEVTVENVPSYRYRKDVAVEVEGFGEIKGDVAWGGNWFFLIDDAPVPLKLDRVDCLTDRARRVRDALWNSGITGEEGALIDHLEFFSPPEAADAHSRNFVLCPGNAYDRSPCGTGTSAKLACLAADERWPQDQAWIQEGILGSRFQGRYRIGDRPGEIVPSITGQAYVTGEIVLLQHPEDPFREGISCRTLRRF